MLKRIFNLRGGVTAGFVAVALLGFAGSVQASVQSGNIDLATEANILRIDGAFASTDPHPGGAGYSVAEAGDVNGDGTGDLIIGAPRAGYRLEDVEPVVIASGRQGEGGEVPGIPEPLPGGPKSGSSYVVFGGPSLPAVIDLLNLANVGGPGGVPGFRIDGAHAYDLSGYSVAGAGDVDNDGLDDVIVGAPGADSDSGSSYIIYGKRDNPATSSREDTATVDLNSLGDRGFRIDGAGLGDRAGFSVAGAGYVNDDDYADVIVGAPWSAYRGFAYVVYGKPSTDTDTIDLASLGTDDGFSIKGAGGGDEAGYSVDGAGDVNADGTADVIVGASNANNNGRFDSGSAYVIFGGHVSADIDLANLGTSGFRIDGAAGWLRPCTPFDPGATFPCNGDRAGRSVAGVGDVNGDGRDDMVVGADFADNNGRRDSGSAYVVYGSGSNAPVDLGNLQQSGFRIDGASEDDAAGSAVGGAGDINGDGRPDVIVGAPCALSDHPGPPFCGSSKEHGPDLRNRRGAAYVVFGRAGSSAVDLANLGSSGNTEGVRISGVPKSAAGWSVSGAGDVNGDGADDMTLGAPFADNNDRVDSGSAYVIYGTPTEPPIPPGPSPFIAGQPESCAKVLYENRLEVPREARLADLVRGKGLKVRASASEESSGALKVEITGREARQFKVFRKLSRKKDKTLSSKKVRVGAKPEDVYLVAKGKARKSIKRALRLKKAPKSTKLKVSLNTHSVAKKSLGRLNTQTVRALRRGKVKRTDTYTKVRQVVDRSLCGKPLVAKIKGSRQTKLTSLTTSKGKRGRGVKVKVSCSEDCTAKVGFRLWGRYEIGLKFRKVGGSNNLLSSRTVRLRGGETKTLKLDGVVSKKLRRLLVRGAKKRRYDRVKLKYLIEATTPDGRSDDGAGTSRVLMRFR